MDVDVSGLTICDLLIEDVSQMLAEELRQVAVGEAVAGLHGGELLAVDRLAGRARELAESESAKGPPLQASPPR